jgi:hypothetical protein
MKRIALLLLIGLSLTGCASWCAKDPIPDGMILIKRPEVDPKLLESCAADLTALPDGEKLPLEALLSAHARDKTLHDECYAKVEGWISVWRKNFQGL